MKHKYFGKISGVVKVKRSYVQSTTSWRYMTYVQPMGLRVGQVAQPVYRLTTGWMVRGSNPSGGEIFHPSRVALGLMQPLVQGVPGLSRGYSAAGACC
jgi:hypothetical protein